ncbi:MAG: hypothetical protein WBS22_10725 [Methylocystis sp.]
MQTVSAAPNRRHPVKERACLLYDGGTGAIRHIQHVIVMEGGHDPDEREIEVMCRSAFIKRGRPHEKLLALHIERHALKPFKKYRVDPAKRTLVEEGQKR